MASKSSAVADEPIDVLFALQSGFDLMDFAGPLEVLTTALHDAEDPSELPPPRLCCQPRTFPSVKAVLQPLSPDSCHHCRLNGYADYSSMNNSLQGLRGHHRRRRSQGPF
jgi:hypothetical protein